MPKNVTVEDANQYFADNVLHATEWDEADETMRERALTNAENQLYRYFKRYNPDTRPVPPECVYEQALWLLRVDDTIRKAEQGVKQINVRGITISVDGAASYIAPEVRRILGRRIGWSVL